jgi:hypothetical protein
MTEPPLRCVIRHNFQVEQFFANISSHLVWHFMKNVFASIYHAEKGCIIKLLLYIFECLIYHQNCLLEHDGIVCRTTQQTAKAATTWWLWKWQMNALSSRSPCLCLWLWYRLILSMLFGRVKREFCLIMAIFWHSFVAAKLGTYIIPASQRRPRHTNWLAC